MPGYSNEMISRLMEVISLMGSAEECEAFFSDLCTIRELQDMAQRFETAQLLKAGKNYREISESVGVSTATISRVSRCLNYGSGGYKNALEKLEETEKR